MSKAVVLLSGGQDSVTCLFLALERFGRENVFPLTIFYGQKHVIELDAAEKVVQLVGLQSVHEIIELPQQILKSTSPLVKHDTPVAQYNSPQDLPGGIEDTFVPLRNLLFLVLAANRAVYLGAEYVVTGVGQEDFGGYPDCRESFLKATQNTVREATGEDYVQILAPLLHLTKEATVLCASGIKGCLEALAYSHTCYNGVYPPCGHCHACLLRAKGFAEAGIPDPLLVRASNS
jgi:7-cyano-7-deazaguanine synthase